VSVAALAPDYVQEVTKDWHPVQVEPGVETGTDYVAPPKRRVPQYEFRSGSRRILPIKPVQVTLFEEDGCFIACNENLHIWAVDDNPQAALQDFEEQVVYFFYHYKAKSPASLLGSAARLKKLYSESFQESEE
jgi:hypothetical protein